MTFEQVRNAIIPRLKAHVGCTVVPSNEIADMPEPPYGYYSVLAPRIQTHSFGLRESDGQTLARSELVAATMSFTFCSINRETKDGEYIYGEDEALALTEKAHGFFLLDGHNIATDAGEIVVNNVGNVANRSGFFVEDTIHRYGFDVRFSYVRTDETPAAPITRPPDAAGGVQS